MTIAQRWIAAPELRRTYLALVLPGGAAAEDLADAPAGTSHLLEHLLYRQNELDGHPLDHLGASVGLLTTAETQHLTAAVDPEDAPRVAGDLDRWCREPRFPPHIIASETEVVIDEVEQASRSPARAVWNQLIAAAAPRTHLARDFAGDAASLRAIPAARIADVQHRIVGAGGALVAVGPRSPWAATRTAGRPWIPPCPAPASKPHRVELLVRGMGHSVIGGARMFAGASSPDAIGTYARYASLAFGRVHQAQRAFHVERNLRHLHLELRVYRDVAVLAAFARCPTLLVDAVAELVEQLLSVPCEASRPERIRRCALHHLLAMRDDPGRRALEEATRALYGIESLDELLAHAQAMSAAAVSEAAERAALAPPVTVLLVEE